MRLGAHLWLNFGVFDVLSSPRGLLVLVYLCHRLLHIDVPHSRPTTWVGLHPVHWLVHGDDTAVRVVEGVFTTGAQSLQELFLSQCCNNSGMQMLRRTIIDLAAYVVHDPQAPSAHGSGHSTIHLHINRELHAACNATVSATRDSCLNDTQSDVLSGTCMQDIKLYGIVKIKGFYLPFAFMAITMLMGGKPDALMADARGILVGHIWYFFTTLLPRGTGKVYLRTPRWVKWASDKLELSGDGAVTASAPRRRAPGFQMPSAAAVAAGRPGGGTSAPAGSGGGFQAFRGSGNRLGS